MSIDESSQTRRAAGGRPQAETASAAERRFERALGHLRAMLLEFDGDGRVTYVSPTVSEILGYTAEEIRGLRSFEWIHAQDVAQILELSRKLASTGEPVEAIYRARHKQGRWLWLEMSASSVAPAGGELRTLAFVHDVTEARQLGRALRITEDRFRTMAENAADLIGEIDATGRFVYVSPNCETLLGTPPDEFIGCTIDDPRVQDRLHPDDLASVSAIFPGRFTSGGEGQFESRFRHGDGSWRWFETRGRAYRTQGGELRALIISRDITERVRALEKLRESEERYRVLAETTHDLVIELDAEGKILYVSPNSVATLGYTPAELAGSLPFALLHPEDVERLTERFLDRVGSHAPRRGGTVFRVRHRDGTWHWLEGGGVNYRTAGGAMRVVAVARDVTEKLRAEEERHRLEDWIRQAQKLESLGLMAGGIAHDFNNLLTPILGDASLALMDLPPGSPARPHLEKIQKTAQRAALLTNQMLDYAGRGALVSEPIDLSRLVGELGELLATTVARRAELRVELPEGLPTIAADVAQVSQVVMNLITNATEAISAVGRGRIDVVTGTQSAAHGDLERMLLGEGLPAGLYVFVQVSDTGCGMTEETRTRIFDPFYTTKFTGRGLGLAAVLGIVRGHRGAIDIESAPGRGTRFRVLFPAGNQAGRPLPVPATPPRSGERGKVLVVDDDPAVLEVTAETLARAGFDVLRARDGASALTSFREHAGEIRVVLLDLQMPGASGEDTFDAIQRIRPDARVILVSGYAQDRGAGRLGRHGAAGYLRKPYLPALLLDKVYALLDA